MKRKGVLMRIDSELVDVLVKRNRKLGLTSHSPEHALLQPWEEQRVVHLKAK